MDWKVFLTKDVVKRCKKLSRKAVSVLDLLITDLETNGPAPGKHWHNYGKLAGQNADCRHCHLIKGNPTYVCCWKVIDNQRKIIEVYYAGTHEKAPY